MKCLAQGHNDMLTAVCHGLALGHNKKRGKDKNIYEKGIYLAKLKVAKGNKRARQKRIHDVAALRGPVLCGERDCGSHSGP